MRYWDASAVVPLLVQEARTTESRRLLGEDPMIVTWWGTSVECASALNRLHRDGAIDEGALRTALDRLATLGGSWAEVQPSPGLRRVALRLLRVHALRAADALQLAAAVTACRADSASLPFVSGDARLTSAAEREGFPIR